MIIRQVRIERFRGIKELEWNVGGNFVCLVGAGDSTKSTILDAIEVALSPRWNIQFEDTDFYEARTEEPIKITVTVGDVPEELKSDMKYGYLARGWNSNGELHDEPEDDDELVFSIQLRVETSLEQVWAVVNDRDPEGNPITAKDREKLGCARLGDFLDRHFSWSRGSVLARLTGEVDGLPGILADAGRAARAAMEDMPSTRLPRLHEAAKEAKRVGRDFGVAAAAEYRPQLDVQALSFGLGGFSLHDGAVPLRRAGLGTRRLLAVAMQHEAARMTGVTLIDEIEQGLEPHRVRHLLRVLRGTSESQTPHHVLMTTHSPVVLGELEADQLRIVRSCNGVSRVLKVEKVLQPIIRKASEAFLARKVLVCEGKTEVGFCRCLDRWWGRTGASFSLSGIALADGNGTEAPNIAQQLANLSYDIAFLGDSDQPLNPDQSSMEASGVRVFLWNSNLALEQCIARDLPWVGVAEVVLLAMAEWDEQRVREAVAEQLKIDATTLCCPPDKWINSGIAESVLRHAVGLAAKDSKIGGRTGWFKRVDLAEALGDIVVKHYDAIEEKDLGQKIAALGKWVQGNG